LLFFFFFFFPALGPECHGALPARSRRPAPEVRLALAPLAPRRAVRGALRRLCEPLGEPLLGGGEGGGADGGGGGGGRRRRERRALLGRQLARSWVGVGLGGRG